MILKSPNLAFENIIFYQQNVDNQIIKYFLRDDYLSGFGLGLEILNYDLAYPEIFLC